MIRWDAAGEHIIVERPEQLALHVLPSVYRQSRFASFSRQLNVRPLVLPFPTKSLLPSSQLLISHIVPSSVPLFSLVTIICFLSLSSHG
jgi:hypothetical protein